MVTIDLTGKSVLVTGGSRGIGAEAARLFVEAGASVGVNWLRSEGEANALVAELGRERAEPIRADLGDPAEVERMVERMLERFGRIDVLVNNAGRFVANPFDGDDYEAWQRGWRRTIEVNLFGPANAAYLAMRAMRARGGGRIVNVASRAAFRGETEFADYGASKAALVNLTRSIARACAPLITAVGVAPGFVETDMAAEEIAAHRDELIRQVPLGRFATVAEVAAVIVFAASSRADSLNGATIDVNGGSWFQ
ncbi:MAG TPA: SDR family NAD(P)-dependent oxidoreductase [Thermoanaerobaculia bacterium]|nr:SDR family NAD(P)-dependent oxidoreductase [Thermoanaerobaculia bacterium]